MSAKVIKRDEAVPETLVYIAEASQCPCGCHDGEPFLDDQCCRYPGYRPHAHSIQEAFDFIRVRACLRSFNRWIKALE